MSTDRPRWTPTDSRTTTHCRNCGAHVLEQTARVFGDETDTLWHCSSCEGIYSRDLKQGAGANPDYDPLEDRGDTSSNLPIFEDGQ